MTYFIFFISLAFVCSLVLVVEDSKNNNIINKSCFDSIIEDKLLTNNGNDIIDDHLKASLIKSLKR